MEHNSCFIFFIDRLRKLKSNDKKNREKKILEKIKIKEPNEASLAGDARDLCLLM